ncbi:hypothetical protein ACP4OV_017943 [Aristida adscensionis]
MPSPGKPTAAEIKIETFKDLRSSMMFEKFGFSQSGAIRMVVSGAAIPKKIGFLLFSHESLIHTISGSWEGPTVEQRAAATDGDDPVSAAPSGCVLNSPNVKKLFTFHDMKLGHLNKTFPVTHPDEYTLFFANCAPQSVVTMRAGRWLRGCAQPAESDTRHAQVRWRTAASAHSSARREDAR